jgi:cell division septum initiation protein DivIVA
LTDQALRRVDQLLTELVELVETARAVPMSASCVVPREHVLDLLDDLREVLPAEMDEARRLAAQRDTLVAEATAHGERIRDESERTAQEALTQAREQAAAIRAEADSFLREVHASANAQAQELIEGGRAEHLRLVTATGVHQAAVSIAERLRREADDYAAATRAAADRYAAAGQIEVERTAMALRLDAERYAEGTLSDLVEVLNRALTTTELGRQALLRRHDGPAEARPAH